MASVREIARGKLPTQFGEFQLVAFEGLSGQLDDVALVRGDVGANVVVPVRMHSECVTGDAFGSLRCDCGEQLAEAMRRLAERDFGVLLYLRQEGRGIGIANKVKAYELQDGGLDTVEANLHLGFDDDMRSYDTAAAMLQALGARRVELHTNNPNKVEGLESAGITVVKRMPLQIEAREENRFYLDTKRTRSGHLIAVGDDD
ncbi:MAG: GTP cyclohydrolase II [Myxococcota bacterium]